MNRTEMKKEFRERWNRLFPDKRLLAVQLNGFTHTIFYDEKSPRAKVVKGECKQLVYSGICDGKYSWFNVNKKNVPDISKKQEQFYFGPIKKNDYVKQSSKFNFVSLAIIVVAIVISSVVV